MKILVADDDPVSRRVIEACLTGAGYEVSVAVDGAQALGIIGTPDSPRLLVLDRTMPHVDGMDVCRAIRKKGLEPDVYIILLTSKGERDEIAEGFEAGADDYMTKPFDAGELKARVRTGARIVERQEELIASREQLRAEVMYDSLTGLLIMADLDNFKETNDKYGHIAGDAVLVEVARRLRTSMRVSDSVGRYGGEEFVIVAPGCTSNAATLLAERFRLSVSTKPIDLSTDSISVTMSFGVASTSVMSKANGLLRAADEALYRAKNSGKNRVEGAEPAAP
jgi:two-component system cell cycle response regulator